MENVCSVDGGASRSAGEIAADSRTQRPGELCQTRLQHSDTITGAVAVLLVFINSHPRTLARRAVKMASTFWNGMQMYGD